MNSIFVVAEHRDGQIREVTYELLRKANELGEKIEADVSTVLLGHQVDKLAEELSFHKTDEVIVIDDERLEFYNCEGYRKLLFDLFEERKPTLTMVGHTAYGMEFTPGLAMMLNLPLATDCIDLKFSDDKLIVTTQMYGGKTEVEVVFPKDNRYLTTVRPMSFEPVEEDRSHQANIVQVESTLKEENILSKTLEFIQPPAEDVDITKEEILVSVGRGLSRKENLPIAEELVKAIGGVLTGSRPTIDMGWLTKGRQVGLSGKTVKPKLYIALGISGQIQHQMGMKESEVIVAINNDPKAPIFNIADYGIVNDLFEIVPLLTEKLKSK